MTWDDLKGKPKFRDIAAEFLEFARGAEWIIHNAPFDVAFLDASSSSRGLPACAGSYAQADRHAGAGARRVSRASATTSTRCASASASTNAHRTLHGALLDAQLLAEVYLAMTRGQETLTIDIAVVTAREDSAAHAAMVSPGNRLAPVPLVVIAPTAEEGGCPPRVPRCARPEIGRPLPLARRARRWPGGSDPDAA